MAGKLEKIKDKLCMCLVNHVFAGTHAFSVKRSLLNRCSNISIGKGTKVVGPLLVYGELSIGSNCWVGHDFAVEGNGSVDIGDNCDIAPHVHCFTGTHEIGKHERRAGKGWNGHIVIGKGCWICAETKILPGVKIGGGSVLALGSVCNKDISEDALAGGVPAKEIRKLI